MNIYCNIGCQIIAEKLKDLPQGTDSIIFLNGSIVVLVIIVLLIQVTVFYKTNQIILNSTSMSFPPFLQSGKYLEGN